MVTETLEKLNPFRAERKERELKMAKRELSSTLRNLKFMQRAIQKDEKAKKDDEKLIPSATPNRKCIVIMEGNPHPGALKGRMSFQSFNTVVDKLNEDVERLQETQHSTAGSTDQSNIPERADGVPESEAASYAAEVDCESYKYKMKKPKIDLKAANQSQSTTTTDKSKPYSNKAGTSKQQKQDRLDWSLLRPPTAQNNQRN